MDMILRQDMTCMTLHGGLDHQDRLKLIEMTVYVVIQGWVLSYMQRSVAYITTTVPTMSSPPSLSAGVLQALAAMLKLLGVSRCAPQISAKCLPATFNLE